MRVRHSSTLASLMDARFENRAKFFRQDFDAETGGVQLLGGYWYGQHQSGSLSRQTAGGRTGPAVQGNSLRLTEKLHRWKDSLLHKTGLSIQ